MLSFLLTLALSFASASFVGIAVAFDVAQVPQQLETSDGISSKHEFTVYLSPKVDDMRMINTHQGRRLNINFLKGNWTSPSGELIAEVIEGIGGELGFVANDGKTLHLDAKYAIRFVHDNSYGQIRMDGFGTFLVKNQALAVLETDSEDYQHLINRPMFGFGKFHGEVLVIPTFSFEN